MGKSAHSRKFSKLMGKERELMLKGKGAFRDAKRQLEEEEADEFYRQFSKRNRKAKKRYQRSTEERQGEWASRTADMIYNRKQKRGKSWK